MSTTLNGCNSFMSMGFCEAAPASRAGRPLRAFLRQRESLIEDAASHIQHMQKALMQMNVQLHHVVTDITGITGMKIIRAIVAGIRDPKVLAEHRDRRCKSSLETIEQALIGNYGKSTSSRFVNHSISTNSPDQDRGV